MYILISLFVSVSKKQVKAFKSNPYLKSSEIMLCDVFITGETAISSLPIINMFVLELSASSRRIAALTRGYKVRKWTATDLLNLY